MEYWTDPRHSLTLRRLFRFLSLVSMCVLAMTCAVSAVTFRGYRHDLPRLSLYIGILGRVLRRERIAYLLLLISPVPLLSSPPRHH
ncbi:uncharacterized protein SCHCODRAFT_02623561 [Schizophyllum commune H4-8]|uniref:uncharacterized protein n=1 Tax=Schizophyllum commune (strain H4-8 / FGSC 9210) TaxID=578458 RepID=UPI00215F26CD|nr:uncharacterized protein SCHCODRAFT_02623561 [Schizophyllum commune H4-8]KAI5894046.1 hypothetical protein SCHCODRAFT_02623561 [Schizophyllum commune H4-8]